MLHSINLFPLSWVKVLQTQQLQSNWSSRFISSSAKSPASLAAASERSGVFCSGVGEGVWEAEERPGESSLGLLLGSLGRSASSERSFLSLSNSFLFSFSSLSRSSVRSDDTDLSAQFE